MAAVGRSERLNLRETCVLAGRDVCTEYCKCLLLGNLKLVTLINSQGAMKDRGSIFQKRSSLGKQRVTYRRWLKFILDFVLAVN